MIASIVNAISKGYRVHYGTAPRTYTMKVDAGPKGAVIQFRDNIFANPGALVREISDQGSMAKLRPDQRVVFIRDWGRAEERLKGVATILTRLVRLAEEGRAQAEAFALRSSLVPEPIAIGAGRTAGPGRLLSPRRDGTDGFFIARWRRPC